MGYNIRFKGKILLIIPKLSLNPFISGALYVIGKFSAGKLSRMERMLVIML